MVRMEKESLRESERGGGVSDASAEQIFPQNVQDSTTPLLRRKELCKLEGAKIRPRKKKKREPEGWMNTEELRVKWLIQPPLAVLGPRQDGEGRRRSASVGGRERGRGAAARRPQHEAKGTRRTRSSVVQVRLRGRPCTERWLLFARTPEGGGARGEEKYLKPLEPKKLEPGSQTSHMFRITVQIMYNTDL